MSILNFNGCGIKNSYYENQNCWLLHINQSCGYIHIYLQQLNHDHLLMSINKTYENTLINFFNLLPLLWWRKQILWKSFNHSLKYNLSSFSWYMDSITTLSFNKKKDDLKKKNYCVWLLMFASLLGLF